MEVLKKKKKHEMQLRSRQAYFMISLNTPIDTVENLVRFLFKSIFIRQFFYCH